MRTHLPAKSSGLPATWRSERLARIGGANIGVLRMDEHGFDEEVHDYDEAILVLEGRFRLGLEGDEVVELEAGDFYVIPAGQRHRGARGGSHGTLLIFDP